MKPRMAWPNGSWANCWPERGLSCGSEVGEPGVFDVLFDRAMMRSLAGGSFLDDFQGWSVVVVWYVLPTRVEARAAESWPRTCAGSGTLSRTVDRRLVTTGSRNEIARGPVDVPGKDDQEEPLQQHVRAAPGPIGQRRAPPGVDGLKYVVPGWRRLAI